MAGSNGRSKRGRGPERAPEIGERKHARRDAARQLERAYITGDLGDGRAMTIERGGVTYTPLEWAVRRTLDLLDSEEDRVAIHAARMIQDRCAGTPAKSLTVQHAGLNLVAMCDQAGADQVASLIRGS